MTNEAGPDVADKLRRLIETVDIANALTEPLTDSIRTLVEASAAELGSEEASVLVREGDEGGLRFLVVLGKVAEKLVNMTIPGGKGIAGFVMSSGQPMAVANVAEEQSFYDEFDKSTGYSTQIILATPLRHKGEIIGVLEFINRSGDPPFQPFSPAEMDRAAVCADAIASLVAAYESAKMVRDLGAKLLGGSKDIDLEDVREWLEGLRNAPEHKEMMYMAVLLREIAALGESERIMCRELLESLHRFSQKKSETSFLNY